MATVGRRIAESMQGFARGVYKSIDTKAVEKMTNKQVQAKGLKHLDAIQKVTNSVGSDAGKFGNDVMGTWPLKGVRDSARVMTDSVNAGQKPKILNSIKQGHSVPLLDEKGIQQFDAAGKPISTLSAGKIAGTAISVGVAGRVVTGGGVYRDRYGNVNLPGVPFI